MICVANTVCKDLDTQCEMVVGKSVLHFPNPLYNRRPKYHHTLLGCQTDPIMLQLQAEYIDFVQLVLRRHIRYRHALAGSPDILNRLEDELPDMIVLETGLSGIVMPPSIRVV